MKSNQLCLASAVAVLLVMIVIARLEPAKEKEGFKCGGCGA